jgi:glycosyltransferase involved in cell wall biosynthesis
VIHTSDTAQALAARGVVGDRVRIERPVAQTAMPATLQQADALLLPFSFSAEQRDVVSTSFPTKTADYLASGVPVLVHAPAQATIAQMAAAEGWGLVVSEPCEASLARALERLAGDVELRRRLATRARAVAGARHDIRLRATEFVQSLRVAR